jgi:hypothetical protein
MHWAPASPYYFFDRKSDVARERELLRKSDDAALQQRRLFCARCRHSITAHDERIAVNGNQEHNVVNPLGLRFHIACFRQAPGCSVSGPDTIEHTWFAGYAWSIASCSRCNTHLGWLFTSADNRFYGLIVDRLTSIGSAGG